MIDRTSPILEKHVDFILEEEFICNPAFLPFFVSLAAEQSESSLPNSSASVACRATRSVTDDSGETDILVLYTDELNERTAILIEDKVRAGFQPTQQERYKSRGENGKTVGLWKNYWTCLVAPGGYGCGNQGFDARVSIEGLMEFFTGNTPRERFRLEVFERAIHHFETTGVQKEDAKLTKFRSDYAQAAESFFRDTSIKWQLPRIAWSNDTWFRFTSFKLPKGVYITHKASEGHVDMSFPNTNEDSLRSILKLASNIGKTECAQTGKSASLQIATQKLIFTADMHSQRAAVEEAFEAVLRLQQMWHNDLAPIASYDRDGLHRIEVA